MVNKKVPEGFFSWQERVRLLEGMQAQLAYAKNQLKERKYLELERNFDCIHNKLAAQVNQAKCFKKERK
jgi:hypothetical protein